MKIGIMQPYFFPYLGYFQLIHAVNRFVIYDDVNFIKGGWINRNFILGRDGPQRLTMQLSGASPNKLINTIEVGGNMHKLLMTISQTYGRAPFFHEAFPVVEACLIYPEKNLARFLEFSLRSTCDYLGIQTEILVSSQIEKDNSLKGPEKVMEICRQLGASTYVNSIGGQALYDKSRFQAKGLQLYFLQMGDVTYQQSQDEFTPNLSIIDVMMLNSPAQSSKLLEEYTLV